MICHDMTIDCNLEDNIDDCFYLSMFFFGCGEGKRGLGGCCWNFVSPVVTRYLSSIFE